MTPDECLVAIEKWLFDLQEHQQAVADVAVEYMALWRIVYESSPRPPTNEERVKIGQVRGHLFAAVADYQHLAGDRPPLRLKPVVPTAEPSDGAV